MAVNPARESWTWLRRAPADVKPQADVSLIQLTAARAHLRQLFWARNAVLGAICAWIAFETSPFPSPWVKSILLLAVLVNFVTWLRLQQPKPVSQGEVLVQILFDVLVIAAGLHHSGDSSGALADLNFLPLTIAAATLPWRPTLAVFLAIFGLHELVCHFLPGFAWEDPTERRFDLLAGGLIACFVYSMAQGSRLHGDLLSRLRETYLQQRHAAQLGSMAATAVHELSSPLATLAVVVGEMREGARHPAASRQTLDLMAEQIETCKRISSRLLASADHPRAESGGTVRADRFLTSIVEKCRLMQPWMAVEVRHKAGTPAPEVVADVALEQAILVLLHSAPGALRDVEIVHDWDDTHLMLHICDHGPAPAATADGSPGTPLFAARQTPAARHMDFLMAKATIGRFGGTLREADRSRGHSCVELCIPLSSLAGRKGAA